MFSVGSPYSLAKLVDKLKSKGLPVAEDALEAVAKGAAGAVNDWLKESAEETSTPIDDMVVPYLDKLKAIEDAEIEKIDIDGDGK